MLRADAELDGGRKQALVDTGCTFTVISAAAAKKAGYVWDCREGLVLETFEKQVKTLGSCQLRSLVCSGCELGPRKVQVMQALPLDVDVIVGYDVVLERGAVLTPWEGSVKVEFGRKSEDKTAALVAGADLVSHKNGCVGRINVADKDFEAWFEKGAWTMRWKWKAGGPPAFRSCPNYAVPQDDEAQFAAEIKEWIAQGILVPWGEAEHGAVKQIIPLMSVRQVKGSQQKVRPVLDFRAMNGGVISLTGDMPTCEERLREWRTRGPFGSIVDLKRAYLQVRVAKELWVYQAVRWNNRVYLLTRLGFGLSVAPKVMTAIVGKVLEQDAEIRAATSSYIDDIFVAGDSKMVERVRQHLNQFGLVSKEPERLGSKVGVRVLGLRVDEQFTWSRDSELPTVPSGHLTRRQLHSWIGELVGHYPVAGWLRVACSYLQRCTAAEHIGWDDPVSEEIREKVDDVVAMLRDQGDPVKGTWLVDTKQPATLWADASSLALGVTLEIGGTIVEDAAWLCKADNCAHINMSELDAVIRGINLCLKWKVRQFTVKTDSAIVHSWLKAAFEKTHRVRTHALAEMLIRRRLEMLSELAKQEQLVVTLDHVASADNKADQLTRVPRKWLSEKSLVVSTGGCERAGVAAAAVTEESDEVRPAVERIHRTSHFGVDRTLELARARFGDRATRRLVKGVVSECRQCAMIDPAVHQRWQKGTIATRAVWQRLALDITHVNGRPYLTTIDCASRFTVWRALRDESAKEVCAHLTMIFAEMGPPQQLLSDNGAVFRSVELRQLLDVWSIKTDNSCAYRAQGNAIIERVHRTIKRMVARSGRRVEEMTFWYNATKGERPASPYEMVFGAKPRMPGVVDQRQEVERSWAETSVTVMEDTRADAERNPFVIGDEVFVKESTRCDRPWSGPHRVSGILSSVSVTLDGADIPRHVSHLRRVPVPDAAAAVKQPLFVVDEDDDDGNVGDNGDEVRYPVRARTVPQRYGLTEATEPNYT